MFWPHYGGPPFRGTGVRAERDLRSGATDEENGTACCNRLLLARRHECIRSDYLSARIPGCLESTGLPSHAFLHGIVMRAEVALVSAWHCF